MPSSLSDSGSDDDEDVGTTGLIATRAKRSTAGNLYATLRANLDDEELQKDLLAEDEADQGEYEGSDKEDDDDDVLESSSDDEDAGPPNDGDAEDLAGEKELKKQERLQKNKKRKMNEARMRLPAWQKKTKRVKLADDVKSQDGSARDTPEARPRKKSERSNWLPTAADMPVRQSARASAIANREVVHTNLKESALRSEKQKKVMAKHAERVSSKKRADLTQEERLRKAAAIEKETAREFGRWERDEAERQRIREEQLAAKRSRGIDGPVITHWSGSVLWEGEKIKKRRMHGSTDIEKIKDDVVDVVANPEKAGSAADASHPTSGTGTPAQHSVLQQSLSATPQQSPQVSWLDGIQEYAARDTSQTGTTPLQSSPYTPSAPAINGAPGTSALPINPHAQAQIHHAPHPPLPIYHGWPPTQHPQLPLPPVTVPPLVKEQAQRSLIMLEQFTSLETPTTTRKTASKAKDAIIDPTPIASILLPTSYPSFTPDESRYLVAKMKKLAGALSLPPAPPKTRCALTSWPAKFRDPRTGLAYAEMQSFKMIRRVLAGGCVWSGLLGAWVGPNYAMGRAAEGVPEAFLAPATVTRE